MLKYLKNIIIPQSAKPLLSENKLVNKTVSRKKFIELKSKSKKIFIYNRKPSATDYFPNFAFVLNHIKYAKKKFYTNRRYAKISQQFIMKKKKF